MRYVYTVLIAAFASLIVSCGGGGGCASSQECKANTTTFVASPSAAVSVAIGQGDKIETTAQEIKYKLRYAITVSDKSGRPVAGARVSTKINMIGFYKGFLVRDDKLKVLGSATFVPGTTTLGPLQFCKSEDLNNNDVSDPGEDLNRDGALTPPKAEVVAVIEGSDLTNAQGIVYVVIEYPKEVAKWIDYEIVATASVTGTEGKASKFDRTSAAAGDDEKVSTPFVESRYGIEQGCDNTN
jgi:hypothetical protein